MQSADRFGPLKGLCPYKALIGLTQATGLAGGFDCKTDSKVQDRGEAVSSSLLFMRFFRFAVKQGKKRTHPDQALAAGPLGNGIPGTRRTHCAVGRQLGLPAHYG